MNCRDPVNRLQRYRGPGRVSFAYRKRKKSAGVERWYFIALCFPRVLSGKQEGKVNSPAAHGKMVKNTTKGKWIGGRGRCYLSPGCFQAAPIHRQKRMVFQSLTFLFLSTFFPPFFFCRRNSRLFWCSPVTQYFACLVQRDFPRRGRTLIYFHWEKSYGDAVTRSDFAKLRVISQCYGIYRAIPSASQCDCSKFHVYSIIYVPRAVGPTSYSNCKGFERRCTRCKLFSLQLLERRQVLL